MKDFPSIEALAARINEIATNKELYESYVEWKEKGRDMLEEKRAR